MKRTIFIATIAIVAMVGCKKQNSQDPSLGGEVVEFSAKGLSTRIADGDNGAYLWVAGDKIGITTSNYPQNGLNKNSVNVKYAADKSGESTPFTICTDESLILKPKKISNTSPVKYYAYYPYNSDSDNSYFVADISNQKDDPNSADVLFASKEVTSMDDFNSPIAFNFKHRLTKLVFNVEFGEEVYARDAEATLDDLTAQLNVKAPVIKYPYSGNDISFTADEKLIDLNCKVDNNAKKVIVTAIIHPTTGMSEIDDFASTEVVFDINGFKYSLGKAVFCDGSNNGYTDFSQDNIYAYNVILGKELAAIGSSTISSWSEGTANDSEAESNEYTSKEWDGSVATKFNGVKYDESIDKYEITNGCELALLAQLVNNDKNMSGKTFTLTNDIHLSDMPWTSIGNYSKYFKGIFDGGGYTISGLYPTDGALFSSLGDHQATIENNGIIKNLTVEGDINYSTPSIFAGIVAGNFGTIEKCYNKINVTGQLDRIGGIALYNNGKISKCSNKGNFSTSYQSYPKLGGIAAENSGTIEECYNIGKLTATGPNYFIGGIAGANKSDGTIKHCYNRGNISGNGTYGDFIGGIAGENYGTILSVYNSGKIKGACPGGIIGYNNSDNVSYTFMQAYIIPETTTEGVIIGNNDGSPFDYNANYCAIFIDNQGSITTGDSSRYLATWLNNGEKIWASDDMFINDGYPYFKYLYPEE